MSKQEPIIDVSPVASVRDKAKGAAKDAAKSAADGTFNAPSYGRKAAKAAANATPRTAEAARTVTQANVIDSTGTDAKKPSRLAGAAQTVVGGAIMLVGVPMLILPGPGLLAIGGGAVIAAGGVKKMKKRK